ncbi:MAG: hypothetical protein HY094_07765 [Candidatus Melainabacteria bacterium]|nr:hypothetical protein [Candidatus Melainabacteria bacterium]
MKILYIFFLFFSIGLFSNLLFAKSDLPGKDLFYNSKGKYGSCNHCHVGGSSAGRWNFETMSIDPDEGRKIPILKGIGKRKNQEQIERSIQLMKKLFDFKLTDEQISQLAEYLGSL